MTNMLKIRSHDELISSIPHTLGFTPRGMVCLAFGDNDLWMNALPVDSTCGPDPPKTVRPSMNADQVAGSVVIAFSQGRATWTDLALIVELCWPDDDTDRGAPGLPHVLPLVASPDVVGKHIPSEAVRVLRRVLGRLQVEDSDGAQEAGLELGVPRDRDSQPGVVKFDPDWPRFVALTALARSGDYNSRAQAMIAASRSVQRDCVIERWQEHAVFTNFLMLALKLALP